MPAAVRVTDLMSDGGVVVGPGVSTVLIKGLPAAVLSDSVTWPSGQMAPSMFPKGSATVLIGGKPAVRTSDLSTGGTNAAIGELTVMIGG
jgi:uncharacterized Zn-binding protein involved in type VI secretion